MDKCIKVLIPTGEVRLTKDDHDLYKPADYESKSKIDLFANGTYGIVAGTPYGNWVGDWVDYDDLDGQMFFPVIAQYGDEFPV